MQIKGRGSVFKSSAMKVRSLMLDHAPLSLQWLNMVACSFSTNTHTHTQNAQCRVCVAVYPSVCI